MAETRSQSASPGLVFQPILRLMADFANSRLLDAAIEYDFFTLMDNGFHTYEEIAREAGTVPRATRIALDGLITLGLVDKRAGRYTLVPVSEQFLVRGKPSYVGDFRHVIMALWDGLAGLKETLRTGRPTGRLDTEQESAVWEKIVLGILPIVVPAAKALCDILSVGEKRKGLRVLDIAGGSGILGATILEHDPAAQITQLDWPNVNRVARNFLRGRGVENRFRFVDGEFRTAAVEENHYDLALASNFCRFESAAGNCDLFRKVHRALKPGGLFVINDFVPNEERTGPSFTLRFSVYVLAHTAEGECYTLSEYTRWLTECGFTSVQSHGNLPGTLPGTTLVIAAKP